MQNRRSDRFAAVIAAVLTALVLGACQAPKLAEVDDQAIEKPINTPEAAAELQRKYTK